MIKSSLCDYSDAYILFKGTITVPITAAAGAAVNITNKKYLIVLHLLTKINNTEVDYDENIDIVMPM